MYLVTGRIQRGAVSPIVLTISLSFPIRFLSFRSHSCRLRRLPVAGRVARHQLSSRVSYKSFSAIAGPVWPECPIRQLPFPRFRSRSAPPPMNPQLLVSRSRIAGTQCITAFGSILNRRLKRSWSPRESWSPLWNDLGLCYTVCKATSSLMELDCLRWED